MDIQTLKLELVEKILSIEKPSILLKISKLLQKENTDDWWDNLPLELQESVLEGFADVKEGHLFTHDQVIKEVKQKYGF